MRFKGEEEDLFRRCAEEDAARCDAYDRCRRGDAYCFESNVAYTLGVT